MAQIRRCRTDKYFRDFHYQTYKVIIYKLSRLSRNLPDLLNLAEQFRKQSIAFISCSDSIDTSTANGRMVFKMLAVVVEGEREIIAERTLEAMAVRRNEGKYLGGVPYGYTRHQDRLIPFPEQQVVIEQMKQMRARELSFVKIADALNKQGVAPQKSDRWYGSSIQGILKRQVQLNQS